MSTFPVIIDTDPGIDDALALYLALSSRQLDIKGITLVSECKRNLVTLFDVIDKEIEDLKSAPRPNQKILLNRFEWSKPVVAIGADNPIKAQKCLGTDYHGLDGFGQIHTTHPHYTPENWENLKSDRYTISSRNATDEILHQLQNSPPFTITIIALGPLTNLGLAYDKDKYTFSRVKQVISLGGAIDTCGNVTPCAEFNFFADPDAASILAEATKGFSLSETVQNKIERLNRKEIVPLHLVVLPADVASKVFLSDTVFAKYTASLNTPLNTFISVLIKYAFNKSEEYFGVRGIEIYDPLTITLAIDMLSNNTQSYISEFADMKVEYQGIFTRGMTIVDRRPKGFSNDVKDDNVQEVLKIWSAANANNVEIIKSYNDSFFSNFFKLIFDVDYSEETTK